jgi:DNA-binding transcriptional LysR family regulator
MTARGGEPAGRLRVNAPLSFGLKVLSPILAKFMACYPKLTVELTLNDSLLDVVTEGFDVSLRIRASLVDSTLIARRLGEVQQIICAPPSNRERTVWHTNKLYGRLSPTPLRLDFAPEKRAAQEVSGGE